MSHTCKNVSSNSYPIFFHCSRLSLPMWIFPSTTESSKRVYLFFSLPSLPVAELVLPASLYLVLQLKVHTLWSCPLFGTIPGWLTPTVKIIREEGVGTEGTEGKGGEPQTSGKPSRKNHLPRRQDKAEACVSSLWPNVPTQRLVLAGKQHISTEFA